MNVIDEQAFQEKACQIIQNFFFGKLQLATQQDSRNSNRKDASPEEIQASLHRRQQYNHIRQTTMTKPFHQSNTMEDEGKLKTTPQLPNARQTKTFGGKCLFFDQLGHRHAECLRRVRDAENGLHRSRDRQQTTEDRSQYNRTLVCQICEYTGHSDNSCNQRQTSPCKQKLYENQIPR